MYYIHFTKTLKISQQKSIATIVSRKIRQPESEDGSAGGVGGADKKWKGNFWFCFVASDYEMNIYIISFVVL